MNQAGMAGAPQGGAPLATGGAQTYKDGTTINWNPAKVFPQTYKDGTTINWNQPPAQGLISASREQMLSGIANPLLSSIMREKPKEQTFTPNYSPAVFGKMDQIQIEGRKPVAFSPLKNRSELTPEQLNILKAYRPDLAAEPTQYKYMNDPRRFEASRRQLNDINNFFSQYRG